METIITVATILIMYLNASVDNKSQYFYNADIENGQVNTMYVYDRTFDGLTPKLEYRYTYDEAERLTSKEAYAWNEESGNWERSYKLDINYTTDGYEVERSNWDARSHAYKAVSEKAVYHYEFSGLLSVNYLRRESDSGNYQLIDQMLIMNPKNELLLAWN